MSSILPDFYETSVFHFGGILNPHILRVVLFPRLKTKSEVRPASHDLPVTNNMTLSTSPRKMQKSHSAIHPIDEPNLERSGVKREEKH